MSESPQPISNKSAIVLLGFPVNILTEQFTNKGEPLMRVLSGPAVLIAVLIAFQSSSFRAEAFPIQLGLSPDCSQSLLIHTIDSADQEILINVYQFDSPEIIQELVRKISQGVTVRILLEGQPLGKISDAGRLAISTISKAMRESKNSENRLFLMTSGASDHADRPRRFHYDHAKYAVIDERRALITSENLTATGHPVAGYIGNRGWEVAMDDPNLAAQLVSIFESDTAQGFGDIRDVTKSEPMDRSDGSDSKPKVRHIPAVSGNTGEAGSATLVTSPDSRAGIISFIRSASQSLEIEQMSLPLNWKENGSLEQNPIISEAISAAKRGVKVRILLNDDSVFGEDPGSDSSNSKTANQDTVDFLSKIAHGTGVDLQARIVNVSAVEITYIHNKGMIADEKRVFVSSINGTRNAVMENRETAVDLESTDAARYFEDAFDFDWTRSN